MSDGKRRGGKERLGLRLLDSMPPLRPYRIQTLSVLLLPPFLSAAHTHNAREEPSAGRAVDVPRQPS